MGEINPSLRWVKNWWRESRWGQMNKFLASGRDLSFPITPSMENLEKWSENEKLDFS